MTTTQTPTQSTVSVPDNFWGQTADTPTAARWNRAANKAQEACLEPCTKCGKGIQPGSGFVVEIVEGGSRFAANDETVDENDGGYMGCWILGPECGRRIPSTHKTNYQGE